MDRHLENLPPMRRRNLLTCELNFVLPRLSLTPLTQRVNTLDATRVSDGRVVILKHTLSSSPEVAIGRLLMADSLRNDPKNHAIPLLDILEDENDAENVILVLPLLRRLDSPPLASVREFVDLVGQLLQVSGPGNNLICPRS